MPVTSTSLYGFYCLIQAYQYMPETFRSFYDVRYAYINYFQETFTSLKAIFHFKRIVAKRSVFYCVNVLVLPECSRDNEIRYVSLRYG